MTGPTLHMPHQEPDGTGGAGPPGGGSVHQLPQQTDAARIIREVNTSSEDVERQCLRVQQAADAAFESQQAVAAVATVVRAAAIAHEVAQSEHPARREPLPRQRLIALMTVLLDGVACYFAAQALAGGLYSTLVSAVLFLAALAGGEVALDYYRDRSKRVWWALVVILALFVLTLGILRFSFLNTVGYGGIRTALAGAALLTVATGGFLTLGYRALRTAETPQAWRARRRVRAARRELQSARQIAQWHARERDRLISAYLVQVRRIVLRTCPLAQQQLVEEAVRSRLLGRAA